MIRTGETYRNPLEPPTLQELFGAHLAALVIVKLSGKRAEVGIVRYGFGDDGVPQWVLSVWRGGDKWSIDAEGVLN